MAQKQNNAGNADVSSRSFDEILERMRNRVSEISDGGEVDKVLNHDADEGNSVTETGKIPLSEEEQDRAFLQMSQKQSNNRPDQAAGNKGGQSMNQAQDKSVSVDEESSLQSRREDQTSVLEMTEEDELEAQTYQQILAALEVKDLSGLQNDTPNELEQIVSEKSSSVPVSEKNETVSTVISKDQKQPYDDNLNGSLEQDDTFKLQPEPKRMPAADVKTSAPEEKKSSQAIDRLAMVAGSLEKSLGEKVNKISGAVASSKPAEMLTETISSFVSAEEPSAPMKAERPIVTEAAPITPAAAIKAAPQDVQKASGSAISEDSVGHKGQEERLSRIEESLNQLMAAQVENEEKALGLLELQEDSFRKMTSEAQKVAEATASKIAVQSSAHVVLDTIKEHAVPRSGLATIQDELKQLNERIEKTTENSVSHADMTTVQDELKQLNERLEKSNENSVSHSDMTTVQDELKQLNERLGTSVEKQKDAYELMQTSLSKLHEKMSEIGADKKVASTAAILVDAAPKEKRSASSEPVKREEKRPYTDEIVETPEAKAEQLKEEPVVKQEEPVVINEPISAQVLRSFVNAPMINHDIQSDDVENGAVGTGNIGVQGQPLGGVGSAIDNGEQVNVPMAGGHQEPLATRVSGNLTTEFSGQTHQQRFESLVKDKKKIVNDTRSRAKSTVMLAISSMLMFSVSGYLFYDHLKTQESQGAPEMTASVSQPVSQKVATNAPAQGLVGEKRLVKWNYTGRGKANIERLSKNDKAISPASKTEYTDVASNTEIIEVAGGGMNDAPTVTSSLGRHEALDLTTGAEKVKKLANGKFARPPLRIGSSSLRQASAKGVASAMFEVARRYQNGKGVKKNYKEAVKWYSRSADKGYAPAQYRLGTLYERGRGVPKQIEKARDWYRKAAKGGNVKAMHNLGVIFSGQKQIKADYILATKWFGKAAQYGLADSQFNLAIINYNGLGKSKDLKEAYKWFTLAAQNGDKAAKEQKDNLARKMKIKQIMDSRRLVKAWKTQKPSRKANIDLSQKYYWRDYAAL